MIRLPVILSLFVLVSLAGVVMGSSLTIIAYEQSDRTVLIPEALVYTNGMITGKTGLDGTYNLSFEGTPPTIRIAKAGYSDWAGNPAENDTLVLAPLTIKNTSFSVEVLDSDTLYPISDATVEVVGSDLERITGHTDLYGKATLQLRTEQVYDLQIQSPQYQTEKNTFVTGFENITAQYPLIRSDRVSIRVADISDLTPVSGALISIDGVSAGNTNERGILITAFPRHSEHTLGISSPGYESAETIARLNDEEQVLDVMLKRLHTTLFVSAYDEEKMPVVGVLVRVDGSGKGETNEYGRLMISDLNLQEYEFILEKKGFETIVRKITPSPETGDIIFELNSTLVSVLFQIQDESGYPIPDVNLTINGIDGGLSDEKGQILHQAEIGSLMDITAVKSGYQSNSTQYLAGEGQISIILNRQLVPVEVEEFPWTILIGGFVCIIGFFGVFRVLRNRRGAGRKRKSGGRRGSL